VVRARAPGWTELCPHGRDYEQRRLRAALGERLHQIERGRVGPVQVLEDQHGRLRTRAREIPRRHRRELPSPQFLGREFRRTLFEQRNVDQRRDQGRIFLRVEANQT